MELARIPARRAGYRTSRRADIAAIRCDREAGIIEMQLLDVPDFDQSEAEYHVTLRFSTDELMRLLAVAISKDGQQGQFSEGPRADMARLLDVRTVEGMLEPQAQTEEAGEADGSTR